ncbi:hypothetical protein F5Y06DRAFT_101317 [Hypoxylon sp. FL0890]|nr:hypothetical protein F5Y06DRAFT_101317 [Hypoxylon sp. FL0890]
MKCTSVITLGALFASAALAQDFSGSGQIWVINSTDFNTASPADSIGCLDVTGALSDSDCATFTQLSVYPHSISTAAGNCSFTDSTQVANTDNVYGQQSYAYHCREDYAATVYDELYTVSGFNYPFLCHGDRNCFYDIKDLPSDTVNTPVWSYVWGSGQLSVPAGHTKVMWYWDKTS